MKKILVVIGTRPEAIKLAPVILRLKSEPSIHLRICLTGQHRDLIAPIFTFFGISSDDDLAVMTHNQNLGDVTAIILTKLNPILTEYQPDLVIVQGDTSTAFSAALAAPGTRPSPGPARSARIQRQTGWALRRPVARHGRCRAGKGH